ncbi:TPR domain-containing protein [Colletotrichum costaricense]|uniref:TPR domain-containing protein n=2 Tax=Colletotrichum acutatum species complex TaxID=2707335 RepID=A0AAI9YKW8_9PEZI|nr:TPR domain-containing protein [Colletotrichum costaricense]XP_060389166.1 TPR domain-containing protein [Colletotrichum tamarilloi]KAK1513093.1 TPR domain-containing protein [Colletotrichum tamarilloi]KAK1514555.1 TPR domain-containing protein [Colletotrichum costaricense]
MFTVRHAIGKGLGVFASRPILTGQRILTDQALLTITSSDSNSILRQAQLLSTTGRDSLLSLSTNPSKSSVFSWLESIWRSKSAPQDTVSNHTILNIFRNNNFNIGNQTQALFPQVARLNHSCVPNAQGNFNKDLNAFTIHATRNIEPEEEITISYLDEHLGLRQSRQTALHDGYGFTCGCSACSPTTSSEAGEVRRAEIQRKLELFAEAASEDPEDEFMMMLALLDAHEAEAIRGREVSTMYIATARKAFDLGKREEGRELALKGLQLEKEAVGDDSPFYAATLEAVQALGVEI